MPLHLILIMLGLVGFLLWLAFADGDEADHLGFAEAVEEDGSQSEAPRPETGR
jgi:hypothetical protein